MKRDLIINYSKIMSIREYINGYKSALETMECSLKSIKEAIETENSGEAITALIGVYEEIQEYINSCKEELSELYKLFEGYHFDMTKIIEPKVESIDMQVDRNDIWFNLKSISGSIDMISRLENDGTFIKSYSIFIDEEEKKNEEENYKKLEEIKSQIGQASGRIKSYYSQMEQDFNSKVVPYENTDDEYASKVKSICNNYGSPEEAYAIQMKRNKEDIIKAAKGSLAVLKEAYNFFKGIGKYVLGAAAAEQEEQTGVPVSEENQKYIEAFKKGNETIKAILNDPEAAIEGMIEGTAQQISDAYDQKGAAYCLGYGGTSLALAFAGDKFLGKVTSIATKSDEVLTIGKIAINGEEISMAEILAKRGISKVNIEVVIKKLDTGDLEKLYKYLEKKPIDFKCDDIIDRIEKGENIDDIIKGAIQSDIFEKAGLDKTKIDEILSTTKGGRPDPSTYLSKNYIENHLKLFDNGASYIMPKSDYDFYYRGVPEISRPDGTMFFAPKDYMDNIIKDAKGDISVLEDRLGYPKGSLADGDFTIVNIENPRDYNAHIPSGNEHGANSEWIPSGYTSGGIPEIILEHVPNDKNSMKTVFFERK